MGVGRRTALSWVARGPGVGLGLVFVDSFLQAALSGNVNTRVCQQQQMNGRETELRLGLSALGLALTLTGEWRLGCLSSRVRQRQVGECVSAVVAEGMRRRTINTEYN